MLELSEQTLLIQLARDTLETAVKTDSSPILKSFADRKLPELFTKSLPCFVTLVTKTGRLRGCIGYTESKQALYKNVYELTLKAAFQDPRFLPVTKDEVPNLKIEISVLGDLKPLPQLIDCEIGKHGLYVQSGNRHGLLLAKVAVEHGFSREEFLEQTCVKAGLDPKRATTYELFYFEEFSFAEINLPAPH